MIGEQGSGPDCWVFQTVLRLLDGCLSGSELDEFCSLLASNQLARQSYLQCVQAIAELQLHARDDCQRLLESSIAGYRAPLACRQ